MRTLSILVQMIAIISGLLAVVGAIFYAIAWLALAAVSFVPIIGNRHRHKRWDELNASKAGESTEAPGDRRTDRGSRAD